MISVVYIGIAIGLFYAAGYAFLDWFLPESFMVYKWFLYPILGVVALVNATLFFAFLGLTGKWVSILTLALVTLLLLLRMMVQRKIKKKREGAVKNSGSELWMVMLVALFFLANIGWPLLSSSAPQFFLGYTNPDAFWSTVDTNYLYDHSYWDRPAQPDPQRMAYWSIGPGESGRFGAEYITLILHTLFNIPINGSYSVALIAFVLLIPLSVFVCSRLFLGLSFRVSLLAMVVVSLSGMVYLSYFVYFFGQNSILAIWPFSTMLFFYAAKHHENSKLQYLSVIVLIAVIHMYYPIALMLGFALAVYFGFLIFKKLLSWKYIRKLVVLAILFSLLLNPYRIFMSLGPHTLWATQVGMLRLDYFASFLTEDFFPVFLGLINHPFSLAPILIHGSEEAWLMAAFALVVPLLGVCLLGLVKLENKETRAFMFVLTGSFALFWVYYTFLRPFPYAVYKLAGYFQPVLAITLASGFGAMLGRQSNGVKNKTMRLFGLGLLLIILITNAITGFTYARLSVSRDTLAWNNWGGSAGNKDIVGLKDLETIVDTSQVVLIDLPSNPQTQWITLHLINRKTATIHGVYVGDEPYLPLRGPNLYTSPNPAFILMNRENKDISVGKQAHRVWENGTFQLVRLSDLKNYLAIGSGWYPVEEYRNSAFFWQHRFRWTVNGGELLIFNPTKDSLRIRFNVAIGFGSPSIARTIQLKHHGQIVDTFNLLGYGSFISKPFRASGPVDTLRIFSRDTVELQPRKFTRLYNTWVKHDYRYLNFAFSSIEVLDPHEIASSIKFPTDLDFSKDQLQKCVEVNGLFPDQWVTNEFSISMDGQHEATALSVTGMIPGLPRGVRPDTLRIFADGKFLRNVDVTKPGSFISRTRLPEHTKTNDPLCIRIVPNFTFIPMLVTQSKDWRKVSFILNRVELMSDEVTADLTKDAVLMEPRFSSGNSLDGWNSALSSISIPRGFAGKTIRLTGELPNIPGQPFPVKIVVLKDGRSIMSKDLSHAGSFTVEFTVPKSIGRDQVSEFQIESNFSFVPSDRGINSDTRSLSYRVVKLEWF